MMAQYGPAHSGPEQLLYLCAHAGFCVGSPVMQLGENIDWPFFSHTTELKWLKPKETFSEPVVSYWPGILKSDSRDPLSCRV